jgi:hypothetical protein
MFGKYPSRWAVYISIAIILIIISLIVLFGFVPINPDLSYNIVSEIWGMVATIFLLILVVEGWEYREWKAVENMVETRFGGKLYGLFNILARFIHEETFRANPSKEEVIEILETLNKKEETTLTQYFYENFLPKKLDTTSVYQLKSLYYFRQYFRDLEIKYSRFFNPNLRISLMEIQDHLDEIEANFVLLQTYPESEQLLEVIEKVMPKRVLGITKEMCKINKMGIEICHK